MQTADPSLAQAFAMIEAGRKAEGLLIVNQLATRGEAGALFALAEWKWCGGMVPQNLAQGRDFFRRAGDAGHAHAASAFTNLLASGIAGPRDWPGALQRLQRESRADASRRRTLDLVERMALDANGDPATAPAGRTLSASPQVVLFPKLFSEAECDYLRAAAEPGFEPSIVVDVQTGRDYADPIRTSDGATLHWLIEDPAVHALNRRLAAASGTAVEQGEPLQVLRYRPGQQYRRHSDFVPGHDNVRVKTALVWLNADYEGGETCFTRTGLALKGGKGDAIVFCNVGADRRGDPMAEHAGLPVERGIKYLASRWIREARHTP